VQSLYALRVLRLHGMPEAGLHDVFRAVVVSWLTYATDAWSGLIAATDRQRVDAFLRRIKRCGFCPPALSHFDDLTENLDSKLFNRICNNTTPHAALLPPSSAASQHYQLRPRAHNRQLPDHASNLMDNNFIIYTNSYLTRIVNAAVYKNVVFL
jgi:hypothetical protein